MPLASFLDQFGTGWPPLHLAAYYGQYEEAERLIHRGANKDAKMANGEDLKENVNGSKTSSFLSKDTKRVFSIPRLGSKRIEATKSLVSSQPKACFDLMQH